MLRALGELKRCGRIVRRHGSGTYVATPDAMPPLSPLPSEGASNTIVVIAKPDHGFFDYCVAQLYASADNRDYEIVYQLIRSQHEAIQDLRPVVGQAAGFILFGYTLAPIARTLQDAGNRVVIVGSPDADEIGSVPIVCSDHATGGALAVKHLLDFGHRRIAFTAYYLEELRSPRWLGYRSAMDEARRNGVAVSEMVVAREHIDGWRANPQAAYEYFAQPDAPTALVAWNDFTAAPILDVLQRAKVRVPEDVSVIGYDNMPIAERLTPQLTTIDSGVPQLLSAAIRIVTASVRTAPTTLQMTIPNLVVRNSVTHPRS